MTRRTIGALALAAGLAACGGDPEGTDAGPPPPPPPSDAGGPPGYDGGDVTRVPEAEAEAMRESCAFERGAFPWQTIGEEFPIGDELPFDHLFLLMQENRSFDHYFGTMPGVDGIPVDAQNPDADGAPVTPFHTTDFCIRDVNHGWNGSHAQFADGANTGFVTTNDPLGARALGYLDRTDLPFYWDLAETFAFSDHHHCSVLGPTFVNRLYHLGASSVGRIDNGPADTDRFPAEGEPHVFAQLDRVGVEWRVYYEAVPVIWGLYPSYGLHPRRRDRARPIAELYDDLAAGDVPPVVFVDPGFEVMNRIESTDEHPPANPQHGQAWVRGVVTAVMGSPVWTSSVMVITYDEHGGFYDHVPPPDACPPGDYPPDTEGGDVDARFDRLGFRVPLWVVSPWSRPGYVSDRVTDLTSVTRLVQTRFGMPALSGRDANAWPMLDMFDFDDPAFMTPPTLAEAPIEDRGVTQCAAAFPDGG